MALPELRYHKERSTMVGRGLRLTQRRSAKEEEFERRSQFALTTGVGNSHRHGILADGRHTF